MLQKKMNAKNKSLGICAFPNSEEIETAYGLKKVIAEFRNYLIGNNLEHNFYEKGFFKSSLFELKAYIKSLSYIRELNNRNDHSYFAVNPVAGIYPVILRKKPLITAIHDMLPFEISGYESKVKFSIKRKLFEYCCLYSDRIIVPFNSTKMKIIELFNIDKTKIVTIPYGVNHEQYYPNNNIKKIRNSVAYLGAADSAKGMDSLIEAFQYVKREIEDAKLILASTGKEINFMTKLASDILPHGSYEFLGFVPESDMNRFYNSAHIFVFPSRYGFGLSALEAMACGTPAISGAVFDSKDFIDDDELLTNPYDPKDIAQKIVCLMKDRKKYEQKKIQCISIASKYSWSKMAKAYYNTCIDI